MKLARKSLSLLMALVMLLTMASPAFAATLANPYTIEVTASCSNIYLDGVAQDTSGLSNQVYDDETTLAAILGGSGAAVSSITADNEHKKADGTARQIVGWRILHRGPDGHEEIDMTIYSTSDILAMAAKDVPIPAGLENYIQFQAVWDDSEFLYHSNVDFSPFYGTIQWADGGLFTGTNRSYTGGRHCEGDAVTTNLNTDTTYYDGDVFGKFEGWVKAEYEFDSNGMDMVDIEVIKGSDGNPIVYSFDDILQADANDTDFHIAPVKNVAYLAKWKNIPLSEYANYGVATDGSEDTHSFVQVDMKGGTADVSDYNTLTQNDDPTLYEGQGLIRAQLPHGSAFAVRFGYLHNFYKENASFEGFYRYVPTTDAEGNLVYNLYTEDDGSGNQVPQLYDEDSVVNFGPVAEDDLIYVAKWSDLDEDHYLEYHPIMQEGSNEPEDPTNFAIGFDIYGGTAKHVTPDDPNTVNPVEGGPNGVVQLATVIEPDVKFSDTHGTDFIYDMAKEDDEFEGWLVYKFLPSAGMFVYTNATTVSNADALASTYHEDIIYVAKWKNVPLSEYENYVVTFEGEEELPEEINLSIQLGNATTVTITTPDGTVTLDKDSDSYDITLLRGQPLSEKVSGLSAELDTTDYNQSARWSISNEQEYGHDIAAEDLIDRGYESDTTLQPLYYGSDVSVNFHGASVTVTRGDTTDTYEDGFGYPSVYNPDGITLKSGGYDSVDDPEFYMERGDFLGWNILVTTDYEQGPGEPINSSPISSANIVNYVFPKNAVMVQFEAVWEDDDSDYFANIVFDVLEGTAVLDRDPDDPENMPGHEERNVVVDWGMRFNETIGEQLGLSRPVDMKKDGATFDGWMQISLGEDGRYALVSETPVADSAVMNTKPTVNTFYVAKWSDTELARYTDYVNMLNGGDEGEEGPRLPQIGGEEGYDIEIGDWTMTTTLTIVKDGETFTDTVNSFTLGKVQKGDTLKDLGVTDISDAKFVYDEDRDFLGWRLVSESREGQEDCFPDEVFTSAELLELEIPECEGERFRIFPVWADLDEIYLTDFSFDAFGGTFERGDGERHEHESWWIPRGDDLKEQIPEEMLPKNPLKEGDEFLGWKRVPYQYIIKNGVIDETVFDTSDETIYTETEDLYDVDLSAPYTNVVYVAVWKNLLDENPDAYKNYPEGNPGGDEGGGEGDTFEGGWVLLAGEGSLELSADQNGEHFVSVFSGQEAAWILVNEGKSPNQVPEEEGITDFGYNPYHAEKSFAGWNVYSLKAGYTDRLERSPVGENTPAGPEAEYVPEEEGAFVIYESWIEDEEDGKTYDVFTIVTEYSLVASDVTTEQLLAEEGLDEVYLCVAQWEEAEKSEVVLPDADPDDQHAIHVQQGVVDIPEIPADPNDPNSEPKFETMEQVKDALDEAVAEVIDRDVDGKNKTVFMEIKLMVQEDGRGEWREVHEDDFPEEGLDVYIPFPKGTGRNGFKFVIAHLISSGDRAGQVETFEEGDYEITDKGIKIHVYSLSPFAVGYEEVPTVTPSNPGESTPNRQNPNTGVHF